MANLEFSDAPAVFLHDTTAASIMAASTMPNFRKHRWNGRRCDESVVRGWQAGVQRALPANLSVSGRPWKTCAVVGSSGSLVFWPRGRYIDQHEAIFRVNDAPVSGYERFVGARTTVRVWGSIPLPWNRSDWNETDGMMLIYCQPAKWLSQCWTTIATHPHPRVSPLLWKGVRSRMRAVTNRTLVGTFPSTGLITIWTALRLCDRITLFGFGNGSFDCVESHQTVCSKYNNGRPLSERFWCSFPKEQWPYWRMEDYVRQSTFHDLVMESEWIRAMVGAGPSSRLFLGPCPMIERRNRRRREKRLARLAKAREMQQQAGG